MKVIEPSSKILRDRINLDAPKAAEFAGRKCYQSTHKIKKDSWKKFIETISNRGHTSVLEHGSVYFKTRDDSRFGLDICGDRKFVKIMFSKYSELIKDGNQAFVYTNLRVVQENHPVLFEAIMNGNIDEFVLFNFFEPEINDRNRRVSVEFIVDRGITHELVRHRVFSFSQESTRYCNYKNDAFGNELTFIRPFFWEKGSVEYRVWLDQMQAAEDSYINLTDLGAKAEHARSVLPSSTKADIVMTGSLNQWRDFFKLRIAPGAHPQMRQVAIPLLKKMHKQYEGVFEDLILMIPNDGGNL